jgi:hypothetical protein
MRAQEFLKLLAEHNLFEINMGSKSLRRAVRNIDALAGIEFEMVIPAPDDGDPGESEQDLYQDKRAGDIDDIIRFFDDGDYNGSNDLRRLRNNLDTEYREWRHDQIENDWLNHGGYDYFVEYYERHHWDEETAMEDAVKDIREANPDLPEDSQEFQDAVADRVKEALRNDAEEEWSRENRIYREASAEYHEEHADDYSEEDWTESEYPRMSNISDNFEIMWPHWTTPSQDTEVDISTVADSFRKAIGKPVDWSERYHGASRDSDTYAIEPDSSIKVDNKNDKGLEFISPPLPLKDALADLAKVKKWADSVGAYTNDSTGLHINVSVPDLSTAKLDYVKLALLLGDERVLNEFGRLGNTYTESALKIVKDRIRDRPDQAEALLTQMRENLGALATKAIHTGNTEKYTSINPRNNYIEFRSPGGDWLESNFSIIEPTLMRFVVALDAALDPAKHREEYLKKLYTVLSPKSKKDAVGYFAQYVAGELPKQALKSFIRQVQLERKIQKEPASGKQYWWNVSRPGYFASIEVVAANKEEAIAKALEPGNYPDWAKARDTLQATPIRPYEQSKKDWGIWLGNSQRFVRQPNPNNQSGQELDLRRFSSREDAEQFLNQTQDQNPRVRSDAEVREIPDNYVPPAATPAQGRWGRWIISNAAGTAVGAVSARNQTEAETAARAYLLNLNPQVNTAEFTVAPENTVDNELKSYNVTDASGYTMLIQATSPQAAEQTAQQQYPNMFRNIVSVVINDRATSAARAASAARVLVPTGPGPWEIYRRSDNTRVRELSNTNRLDAENEARNALGLRGEAPELYGVRTRQSAAQPTGGTFRGTWAIQDPDGNELHRFSGVGNVQSDANRVATNWLRARPGTMQAGVTVVPIMEP